MLSLEERHRVIRQADSAWNVGTFSQVVLWIYTRDPDITFADIERDLRIVGSKTTYLVAKSLASMPKSASYNGALAAVSSRKLDGSLGQFWIWVCINGPDDMLSELAKENKSIEQNLIDLAESGFMGIEG